MLLFGLSSSKNKKKKLFLSLCYIEVTVINNWTNFCPILLQNVRHRRPPHIHRHTGALWCLLTTTVILWPQAAASTLLCSPTTVPSTQSSNYLHQQASYWLWVFQRLEARSPGGHNSTYIFILFWWPDCEKRVCSKGLLNMTNNICKIWLYCGVNGIWRVHVITQSLPHILYYVYTRLCPLMKPWVCYVTRLMECFTSHWEIFHTSIWETAHRKCLEWGGRSKENWKVIG